MGILEERKRLLREKYNKQKKKIIEEEKAKMTSARKKDIRKLLKLLDEIVNVEKGLNILNSNNHSLLAGFLVSKISKEDSEKYIDIGSEIINRIKKQEDKIKEDNRKKREEKTKKENIEELEE